MGDDLSDIAMSYIDEPTPIWQPVSVSPYIAVEEPEGYRPAEFVVPSPGLNLLNLLNARLTDSLVCESPIHQYYNSLCSPEMTEEQSEAYRQFVKAERKREEKEKNYEQFKEFTRILERTYYN